MSENFKDLVSWLLILEQLAAMSAKKPIEPNFLSDFAGFFGGFFDAKANFLFVFLYT